MDVAEAEAGEAERTRTVCARPWWIYAGIGIPDTVDGIVWSYVAIVPIVALTIWGYVDISARGRIVPGNVEVHRTDFTVFTEAGAAFFDGRDPYKVTNPRGWNYLYPPLFAILVSPLSILDSQSQVIVWYVISILLGIGCCFEAHKLWLLLAGPKKDIAPNGRWTFDPALWFPVCASLAVFLPSLDCLQRGQLGIALVYALMLGYRLAFHGKGWLQWGFGGAVLAWPVVVKLIPALPVAVLLLQAWSATLGTKRSSSTGTRAAVVSMSLALGGILFVFAIPSACVGWQQNLHHLRSWIAKVATNSNVGLVARFNFNSVSNQSLANAAHLLSARAQGFTQAEKAVSGARWLVLEREAAERRQADYVARRFVQIAQGIVLVVLGFIAARTSRAGDEVGRAATYGLACLAILLISPLAWVHYYVFALPAVLWVPLWLEQRGRRIAAMVLAASLPGLIWSHYIATSWCGPIGLLGLGTAFWYLTASAFALFVLGWSQRVKTRVASPLRRDIAHDPVRINYPTRAESSSHEPVDRHGVT
jgi:hypothetical protein